jgi:hypothetical protein
VVADPSANQGKGIGIPHYLHGFIEFALGSRDDVTWDIHLDRANFAAGRRSVAWGCIYHCDNFSIGHLCNEMALLMTSKANGAGLHFQTFLSFIYVNKGGDFMATKRRAGNRKSGGKEGSLLGRERIEQLILVGHFISIVLE